MLVDRQKAAMPGRCDGQRQRIVVARALALKPKDLDRDAGTVNVLSGKGKEGSHGEHGPHGLCHG